MIDCILKSLLSFVSSECFIDLFLHMAERLAAQTENTVDDLLVEELRKRLVRDRSQ
jgi:hypothetical protein